MDKIMVIQKTQKGLMHWDAVFNWQARRGVQPLRGVLKFRQQNVRDYAALLHAAKTNAGLLQRAGKEIRFSP